MTLALESKNPPQHIFGRVSKKWESEAKSQKVKSTKESKAKNAFSETQPTG